MKQRAPLERDIQSAICDYLAAKRHFFRRINNTPIYDPTRKAFRAMPKYSGKGMSDILVIHVGRPYFLEVKRPGASQSTEQKAFQSEAEQAGALYAVVRSIDDVQQLGL